MSLHPPSAEPEPEPEPELSVASAKSVMPERPTFADPYEERKYVKERLTLAFRIFAKLGFEEGVSGHITVRDPVDPTTFWVNPFGVAWPLLRASLLIRVSDEGEIVDGGPVRALNTAAFLIHSAVHKARPEINAVAHSHSVHGRAFSALGRELDMITQDSCAFHDDIALHTAYGGVVLSADEGAAIARTLGRRKAVVMANHGLLTCGASVESCVRWFACLEGCCRVQLLADAAAADTVKIGPDEAARTRRSVGSEYAGWFSALPAFDLMEREAGPDYKM